MKNIIVLFLVGSLFTGCATLLNGPKQEVNIHSLPSGAQVIVTTTGGMPIMSGNTPFNYKLPRNKDYKVSIKMDGYKEQEVWINKEFSLYVAGNLLCGGPLGLALDVLSGSMYDLSPDEVYITLDIAEHSNGYKELYALINYYDESKEERVNIPIPLEKIN